MSSQSIGLILIQWLRVHLTHFLNNLNGLRLPTCYVMEGFPAKDGPRLPIISGSWLPTRLRTVASTLSSHCNADKLSVLTAVCGAGPDKMSEDALPDRTR